MTTMCIRTISIIIAKDNETTHYVLLSIIFKEINYILIMIKLIHEIKMVNLYICKCQFCSLQNLGFILNTLEISL